MDYSLEVCKSHQEISITNWFIRGSALGPIGSLSARQFNGCLPRREEKVSLCQKIGLIVNVENW